MKKTKIFIDGSEGTTGLRIYERFEGRDDIELLRIASELRKDADERKQCQRGNTPYHSVHGIVYIGYTFQKAIHLLPRLSI